MKSLFLILSLCFSIGLQAKVYSHSFLKAYDKGHSLNLRSEFPFHPGNKDKLIESLKIGIFMLDEPGDRNLSFTINGKSYQLNIPAYDRDSIDHEYKEFALKIDPIKQGQISEFNIKFPIRSSVTHLSLYFKNDYEGENYNVQFERVKKLAFHRLYEQDSNDTKNKYIRSRGIRDLVFFPSYEALDTAREILDYDPPFNDYDNDYISRDVFKELLPLTVIKYGEDSVAEMLEDLYEDANHRWLDNIILDFVYDMQSSANLLFAIKYHVYSPLTDRRITGDKVLEKIYGNLDADKYMKFYLERIIDEVFKFNDQPSPVFGQERACNAFAKIPQHGLFEVLFEKVRTVGHLQYYCSNALISIFKKLDISSELSSEYHELAKKVILEKYYRDPSNIFHNGYSYSSYIRDLAIYILGELQDKQTLKEALKNPKLGKSEIELIESFL